jgi:hypothetical protein
MITEPEMPGEEPAWDLTGDVIGDDDHPGRGPGWWHRPESRRVGAALVAGAVLASAVWALVLRGTHYGHDAAPDLHGYRLGYDPCASATLEPLARHLPGSSLTGVPQIRTGPALDHATCDMHASVTNGDGWLTDYHVVLTIDLHKKTDPRAEFTNAYGYPDSYVVRAATPVVTRYRGLGDLAYLSAGADQSLSVLHGSAVFTLTVGATNTWLKQGTPPTDSHGDPARPPMVDTSALRPALAQTLTRLMHALSHGRER